MFRLNLTLVLATEAVVLAALAFIRPGAWVLLLAPMVPLTLVGALLARRKLASLAYRLLRLSPEDITGYRPPDPQKASPEELSRSIVERAAEIRRSLAESPSKIRIEMCALGYRACVNDMITLTHLTNEELPNAGFPRRFVLRRARKRATDALSAARAALPPDALRAARQERQ